MRVLCCGGYHRTTVAVARSLGAAGHHVDLAVTVSPGKFRWQRRLASRFIRRQVLVPAAMREPLRLRAALLALVRDGRYDAVLPLDQRIAAWVSQWKEDLAPHAAVASCDWPMFELLHDKLLLHRTLASGGFTLPEFYDYATLEELLDMDVRFPVVIKPRRSSGGAGVRYAADRDELAAAVRELDRFSPPWPAIEDYRRPFVQEYVPGPIHDALFLCRRGTPLATMTARRCTTYPVTGGVTVEAVITRDPALTDSCGQMLAFLGYDGLADAEAKFDERDGRYKLLEINPRIWGGVAATIAAGIDFAAKACELAATGDTPVQVDGRVGLRYWMLQREMLAILQDRGNRLRRIAGLARLLRGDTVCGIDVRDWRPELLELIGTLRLLFRTRQRLPIGRVFSVDECRRLAAARPRNRTDVGRAA